MRAGHGSTMLTRPQKREEKKTKKGVQLHNVNRLIVMLSMKMQGQIRRFHI